MSSAGLILIATSVPDPASEAEADATVEAGVLEGLSRIVYDFRVSSEGGCSPNLLTDTANGFAEPEAWRGCAECLSWLDVFSMSVAEPVELPEFDDVAWSFAG